MLVDGDLSVGLGDVGLAADDFAVDGQGAGLPGVTVTATSPSLQGERITVTGGNGGYRIGIMPAGEYRVSYELEGFATKVRTVKISAAQTSLSDIEMSLAPPQAGRRATMARTAVAVTTFITP